MSKPQKVAASKARNNFSDLISKVEYAGQEFLIERYGEVVAKLVPVEKVKQASQDQSKQKPVAKATEPIERQRTKKLKLKLKSRAKQADQTKQVEADQASKAKDREEKVKVIRKRIKLMLE